MHSALPLSYITLTPSIASLVTIQSSEFFVRNPVLELCLSACPMVQLQITPIDTF